MISSKVSLSFFFLLCFLCLCFLCLLSLGDGSTLISSVTEEIMKIIDNLGCWQEGMIMKSRNWIGRSLKFFWCQKITIFSEPEIELYYDIIIEIPTCKFSVTLFNVEIAINWEIIFSVFLTFIDRKKKTVKSLKCWWKSQ